MEAAPSVDVVDDVVLTQAPRTPTSDEELIPEGSIWTLLDIYPERLTYSDFIIQVISARYAYLCRVLLVSCSSWKIER